MSGLGGGLRSLTVFKEQSLINSRRSSVGSVMRSPGTAASPLWFQLVSGLPVRGRHSSLPSAGGFWFCKRGQRSWLPAWWIALEEKLILHEFVQQLRYSYFVFLHSVLSIFSVIKFILWLNFVLFFVFYKQKAGGPGWRSTKTSQGPAWLHFLLESSSLLGEWTQSWK